MTADPVIESFSAGYAVVHNAEVRTWPENEAHIDEYLHDTIAETVGAPVVGFIDGMHYNLRPSRQVLSNQVAVPEKSGGRQSDPDVLMVQK